MSRFKDALSLAVGIWILASATASAMAAGAGAVRAYGAVDFMSKAQETQLDAEEAKHMERIRANPRALNVKLFKFNFAALDTNIITVVTPEGKTFQYIGTPSVDPSGSHNWVGNSATGGSLSVSVVGGTEMTGIFAEDGKSYRFGTIGKNKRFAAVVEVNLPRHVGKIMAR